MKRIWLSMCLSGAALACGGQQKVVAIVIAKSPPQMHVRHCTARLHLSAPQLALTNISYRSEAWFQCDSSALYGALQVGQEIVGLVDWQPGMISRNGQRMECLPRFRPTGKVVPLFAAEPFGSIMTE